MGSLRLTNEERKTFLYQLRDIAKENSKKIFKNWKTLSDEELKQTDLEGSKKWIRENYLLFEKMEKLIPEKLLEEREKEVVKIFNNFNSSMNFRFKKLEVGKIGKGDFKKLLGEIKRIPNPSADIKKIIMQLEQGHIPDATNLKTLEKWITRRNELWARNETGNFQAMKLKDLWLEGYADEYIWRSKTDGRTRESHLERNGKKFKIGVGILPGEDYGCRCWAEPIMKNRRKK